MTEKVRNNVNIIICSVIWEIGSVNWLDKDDKIPMYISTASST